MRIVSSSTRVALAALIALVVLATGCGQAVPHDDLGQLLFEIPQITGAAEPYPLDAQLKRVSPPSEAASASVAPAPAH